jgi:hypothetical protein
VNFWLEIASIAAAGRFPISEFRCKMLGFEHSDSIAPHEVNYQIDKTPS